MNKKKGIEYQINLLNSICQKLYMPADHIIGTWMIGYFIHPRLISSVDSKCLEITASDQVNFNFICFRLILAVVLDHDVFDIKSLDDDDF